MNNKISNIKKKTDDIQLDISKLYWNMLYKTVVCGCRYEL